MSEFTPEGLDRSAALLARSSAAARELALAVPGLAPYVSGPAAGLDEAAALIRTARDRLAADPQADIRPGLERAQAVGQLAQKHLRLLHALVGEALGGFGS